MRSTQLCIGLLLLLASTASAQDQQYWTNQYGTRSTMLGGAALAGTPDSSSLVYNPAGLAFNDGSGIEVNANAWRIGHIRLINGAGPGADLVSAPLTQVPLLISGVLRIDEWPETRLAWGLLARGLFKLAVSASVTQSLDVIATEPGNESYTGQYDFSTSLSEIHAAGCVSHRVSRELSLGVTLFGALRSQSTTEAISVGAIAASSNVSSAFDSRIVDLLHLRLILKAGVEWHALPQLWLGATLTSPGIGLVGSATLGRTLSVTNVDLDTNGATDTAFGSARQSGLGAHHNSPFAVALGAAWDASPDTRLSLALELFAPIDRYTAIAPTAGTFEQSATGLLPTLDAAMRTTAAATLVFNLALAGEFTFEHFRPDSHPLGGQTGFVGRLSFRTDFTAADGAARTTFEQGAATWDLFHLTLGLGVKNRDSEFTAGLEFSFAAGTFRQNATFANPTESNFLLGTPARTAVDYFILGLVIGYSRNF